MNWTRYKLLKRLQLDEMVRIVKNEVLEQFDKPCREVHWRRNKKQAINFFDESPFAIERQLEDQRTGMKFNHNPQLSSIMKVDVVRSEKIIQKQDAENTLTVKAREVNRIVREASGCHSYALVPPPNKAKKSAQQEVEKIDPDTHPSMKSYAREATSKPIICSFGHRPRSASRTFHPATMKVKLKHGEVVKSESGGRTGFGLPVAVLAQLLYAPKLQYPGSIHDDHEDSSSLFHGSSFDYPPHSTSSLSDKFPPSTFDPSDLFMSPPPSPSPKNLSSSAPSSAFGDTPTLGMIRNANGSFKSKISKKSGRSSSKPSTVRLVLFVQFCVSFLLCIFLADDKL